MFGNKLKMTVHNFKFADKSIQRSLSKFINDQLFNLIILDSVVHGLKRGKFHGSKSFLFIFFLLFMLSFQALPLFFRQSSVSAVLSSYNN